MKQVILLLTMILLLFPSGALYGAEGGAAATFIAKGDVAYKNFDNRAALKYYSTALESEPKNYEAAWKSARAYVDVGEKLSDKKERRSYYEKGYDCAKKAVAINPTGSKGHLFLSIAIARVALDAGAGERVKLSKEVKSEVDLELGIT
jgi:tetratricopeptide (TPR) repeat protein